MEIWLISHYEQTPVDKAKSSRFLTIADYAVERGNEVKFFTSTFKHNVKKQRFESTTSVKISDKYQNIFVKSDPYYKNVSLKRYFAHKNFAGQMLDELKKHKKPNAILVAFPPIDLVYEVSKWAKENNIPFVVDIIDPWPDVFKEKYKFIPSFLFDYLFKAKYKKVKFILKNADGVTAISNQYIQWAKSLVPTIKKSYCFYPSRKFDEMQEDLKNASYKFKKRIDCLTVIYAGSFGMFYDIPTILHAASILQEKYGERIKFIIAGDGTQKEKVENYEKNNRNLEYVGRIPKGELMGQYYKSDLGLIQHIKGATQSVTYKLFDLLACGLPVLNSLDSEMKDIIEDNKVGFFNSPGDAKKLANNIEFFYRNREELKKYKLNAIETTKKIGDSKVVYNKMVDLLEKLAGEKVNAHQG